MVVLNLIIAVVLEGFSSTNKEHTGLVSSQHFNELVEKWTFYDEEATGFILIENLIFLIYELNDPLGRKHEMDLDMKKFIEREDKSNSNKNDIVESKKRHVVNVEKKMIIPFKKAMGLLVNLKLPVYSDIPGQYKCHFKDIVKRTTYLAYKRANPCFDNSGIEKRHLRHLRVQWEKKFPDLKKKKPMEIYDSGKIWAAVFIVSCLKNVVNNKKLNDQGVAHNYKAKEKKDKLMME